MSIITASDDCLRRFQTRSPRLAIPSVTVFLLWVVLVFGITYRILAATSERNLWIDEARLALNIEQRSLVELILPLDHDQASPIGFLLLQKSARLLLGEGDFSHRFIPLLVSILALVLWADYLVRWFDRQTAFWAISFLAFLPGVVSYAGEAKHYSMDLCVTVLLLHTAAPWIHGLPGQKRPILRVALVGALSIWLSFTGVIVLAALSLMLLCQGPTRKERYLCLVSFWLGNIGLYYLFISSQQPENHYLLQYWDQHFTPLRGHFFAWLLDHYLGLARHTAGLDSAPWAVPLLLSAVTLLGGLLLFQRCRSMFWFIAATALLTLILSAAKFYPVAGRLLLFVMPFYALAFGVALSRVMQLFSPASQRFLGTIIVSFWALQPVGAPLDSASNRHEQVKPLIQRLSQSVQDCDSVYLYVGAVPAFDYYTLHDPLPLPTEQIIRGGNHRQHPEQYVAEINALPQDSKWLLFSHRHGNEENTIMQQLQGRYKIIIHEQQPGAALYYLQKCAP